MYEIEKGDGGKAYVSWSGDTIRTNQNDEQIMQINGIFADKLGIKNDKEVLN